MRIGELQGKDPIGSGVGGSVFPPDIIIKFQYSMQSQRDSLEVVILLMETHCGH